MQKLTNKFDSKAILPDQIFDDSISNMAKAPGRTMAEVWERLRQQMDKTTKHSLVSKFLGFSVFIVNLSTKNPVVRVDEPRRCLRLTDSSTKPFIMTFLLQRKSFSIS